MTSSLAAGDRLGPYEVRGILGTGGMGEVHRAHDGRLGRDVAIKVIRAGAAAAPDRLRRFELEARTTSQLNHPAILAVYDVGTHRGMPYLVTEVLEGETLREQLARGALPARRAVAIAAQVARGLAAAHARGIVHRDLKPANLFLTRDGRVKILDFGLARLTDTAVAPAGDTDPAAETRTADGRILGSPGYMAPEQVRGEEADHRADLFALGAVLYEMVSGGRAFPGDSAVEAMGAALKHEPPSLATAVRPVPPAVEDVIRHCLEKDREARFQSAADLAYVLEVLAESGEAMSAVLAPPRRRATSRRIAAVAAVVGLALAAAAFLAGRRSTAVASPTFQALTFRSGYVLSARFAADPVTIIYGACWDGRPLALFQTRTDNPESQPLAVPPADILAVSSGGEMVLSLGRRTVSTYNSDGQLARAPLVGGAPRPVLDGVHWADVSPDGERFAVVVAGGGRRRIEYPIGRVLHESSGWVSHVRIAPDGKRVAFLEHPAAFDDRGSVAVVEAPGAARVLSENWMSTLGLAWARDGEEIWFSAYRPGEDRAVHAVTLDGRERPVWRMAGPILLHDLSADGDALVSLETERMTLTARLAGHDRERDLSWHDYSLVTDISADGTTVLFTEAGSGGRAYGTYLRRADGAPPVRLGTGLGCALSPDGRWVVAIVPGDEPAVGLLPTGAGDWRPLERGTLASVFWANWFPDGRRILLTASEAGRPPRLHVQAIEGGPPVPIGPEGATIAWSAVAPGNDRIAALGSDGRILLVPLSDAPPRVVPGVEGGYTPIRWAADGRSLFAYRGADLPARVHRIDVETGAIEVVLDLDESLAPGVRSVGPIVVTADGRHYAYSSYRLLSRLYVARGLPE